jgi:dTDP-D-glucose 4,6-dehydratase
LGHDRRYAISASKLSSLTGLSAQANFTEKLKLTIEHYKK